MNKYIAHLEEKRATVYAESVIDAQKIAANWFKEKPAKILIVLEERNATPNMTASPKQIP